MVKTRIINRFRRGLPRRKRSVVKLILGLTVPGLTVVKTLVLPIFLAVVLSMMTRILLLRVMRRKSLRVTDDRRLLPPRMAVFGLKRVGRKN